MLILLLSSSCFGQRYETIPTSRCVFPWKWRFWWYDSYWQKGGYLALVTHPISSLSPKSNLLLLPQNNVFVMSNKKSKYPILQVDLRLISDLVVIIVFAAIGGILFSCLGQPVWRTDLLFYLVVNNLFSCYLRFLGHCWISSGGFYHWPRGSEIHQWNGSGIY